MRRILLKCNIIFPEAKALYVDKGNSESLNFKCQNVILLIVLYYVFNSNQ